MSKHNKLVSLNDFVSEISEYYNESKNSERALELIFNYNEFLKQPIKEEMFLNNNEIPLFEDFVKLSQKDTVNSRHKKSFNNFGKNEFQVTTYRKYGNDKKYSFVTSFHLKTINDLVDKIEDYNPNSSFSWCQD